MYFFILAKSSLEISPSLADCFCLHGDMAYCTSPRASVASDKFNVKGLPDEFSRVGSLCDV